MATRKPDKVDQFSAMALGSDGLEVVEKLGQQDVVHDDRLPIKMGISDALLEQLGFKLGKVVDQIFRQVTFPKGWKKMANPGHHQWNMILDEKGRIRATFFFKNAVYDFAAHGNFETRYAVMNHYEPYVEGKRPKFLGVAVVDRNLPYDEKTYRAGVHYKVLKLFKVPNRDTDYEAERRKAHADASGWLADKFPLWDGTLVYWEDSK